MKESSAPLRIDVLSASVSKMTTFRRDVKGTPGNATDGELGLGACRDRPLVGERSKSAPGKDRLVIEATAVGRAA